MSALDELWEMLHQQNAAEKFDQCLIASFLETSTLFTGLEKSDRSKWVMVATGAMILESILNATPTERDYVRDIVTRRIDQKVKELSG